jgi:FkbM family methyltransferase
MAFLLTPSSNCIDIGAHAGDVLRHMVRLAPQGRHIAYEPLPHMAAALRREFTQVDVREVALADGHGETSFVHVHERPAFSGLRERTYPRDDLQREQITVTMSRLDDELPEDYRPDLIKLDVEGGELGVLRGAARTLRTHHPLVWFEHGGGAAEHYGTAPEDVHDLLTSVGLRIFDADGRGPLARDAFSETFVQGKIWNFLAKP